MGSRSLGQSSAHCRRRSCNFDEEMQDDQLEVGVCVESARQDCMKLTVNTLTIHVCHVHTLDAICDKKHDILSSLSSNRFMLRLTDDARVSFRLQRHD